MSSVLPPQPASLALLATLAFPLPAGAQPAPAARAGTVPSTAASACASLAAVDPAQLPNPTIVIASARLQAAAPAAGQTPALPEHCEVVGRLNERIGFNSQHFAINFRLRLPAAWNGRFFFQGGGGTNGNIGNALGNLQGSLPTNALALGYAVVSQDSGHDNVVNNNPALNGAQAFGFDPEARLDFGYRSYDEVTRLAKALIRAHYGRAPERSYYAGCSEGGREGLVMSQRFPDHFDGILSVAPGLNIPKTIAASAWDTQALAALARTEGLTDAAGLPLINRTFTDEDLALASKAVLAACDEFDGLADGMVGDQARCTTAAVLPALAAVTCPAAKQPGCLSAAQIAALRTMAAGPTDSRGAALYADWPWDAGMGGKAGDAYVQGWRIWKLGTYQTPENSALNVGFVATAAGALLTTPPVPVRAYGGDGVRYFLDYPLDTHAARTAAATGLHAESVNGFMRANGTDLGAFKRRGGRLIVVHGASDPIFSLHDSIAWWKGVDAAEQGTAAGFVRLFNVPGMAHCAGGPATDQFDAFAAVVAWVERGTPPDRILATARASSPWPGRTRPLCPYPSYARYGGAGSIEDAASFACEAPAK
jgi:feruloyl esterase